MIDNLIYNIEGIYLLLIDPNSYGSMSDNELYFLYGIISSFIVSGIFFFTGLNPQKKKH
jgi:hypothetical protein